MDSSNNKLVRRIFISSPGDVTEERALAVRVFRRLGGEFADAVTLELVLWEHEPLFAHTGFQEQIPRPSECDLVVSILWSRLGTRLPAGFASEPGQPPPTGTEFEVRDALAAYEKHGRPNLLIYRKKAPPQVNLASADAEERFRQYKQLDAFCRSVFYDAQGAALVAHHGFHDGADFERRLAEHARKWIIRELDKAGEHRVRPRWTKGSPFRGLQAFDAEYQDVFFGRSQALGELIHRLQQTESGDGAGMRSHLLIVDGMSGNGKSSLVRAGLLPFLADRPIEGIAAWYTVTVRPSDAASEAADSGALGAIAAGMSRALPAVGKLGMTVAQLAAQLESAPAAAAARIETCLAAEAAAQKLPPAQVRLLLYIDQLEESFALAAVNSQAGALLDAIAALAVLRTVWVIATLRSDFTHRLQAYPRIMELLRSSPPYTLPPPRGDELLDMIRQPALAAGLEFEERDGVSLDRELWLDASENPESLPLLEYALQQLYEGREGTTLLWDVYKPAGREGGLRAALVAEAEKIFAAADAGSDGTFRKVMRELTSVAEDGSATRRYAPREVFPSASPERAFIDRLIEARLAVTDRQGDRAVVCLAHEALLESWPRAQQWLQQESALLLRRDELQHDANAWAFHDRSNGWLGTAADKLAAIDQLEREGLVPAGIAADYAARSRSRARRNRLIREAAVASICVLSVVAIIAGLLAAKQRDRALAEAAVADRTSQFMVSLFELPDPDKSAGFLPSLRDVLDRGARDATQGLEHEPRIRADLLTAMGQSFTGLGLFDRAKTLLAQAQADQLAANAPPSSRVKTLIAAGAVFYLAGDDHSAEVRLRHAVSIAEAQLPTHSELTSEARDGLADVLVDQGQYAEAERLCRAALAIDRKRGTDGAPVLARTLNTLGSAYYYEHRLTEAEAPMREALALRKKYLGVRNARTVESMNNVAALLYQDGDYAAATRQWNDALPIYREIYGSEHPEVATILNNLGRAALMAGRVDQAVPLLEQTLQIDDKTMNASNEELVMPLNSLGMAYLYEGDIERAQADIDRALKIARLPGHDEILDQVLVNAADVDLAEHRIDRARSYLAEAQALLVQRFPLAKEPQEEWRYAAWSAVNAKLLSFENHSQEASALLARARRVLVRRFGEQGFYVLRLDQRRRDERLSKAAVSSPNLPK